jgi:PIF1-like helicase
VHSTFKAAAIALGLLADDYNWDNALREASLWEIPSQMRLMFTFMCIYGPPTDPLRLFENHLPSLAENFLRCHSPESARILTLFSIKKALEDFGRRNLNFGLPEPDVADLPLDLQPEIDVRDNQSGVDTIFARRQAEVMIRKLNEEQRQAFHSIISAVNIVQHTPKQFFLDGPGGTGKTFLYNAITYAILGEGSGVLSVASTGIAD